MNTANETVVSGEMMQKLREADLASGYEPVPQNMTAMANRALGGRHIANMTPEMRAMVRRQTRNKRKAMRRAGVAGY